MLRMNWLGTSEPSSHPGIGTANPPVRLTQEQTFMLPVAESSNGNRATFDGHAKISSVLSNCLAPRLTSVLSSQSYLPLPTPPFHTTGFQT